MNLFPHAGKPYYIAAPPYDTKSAGVKCLHILCHALNMKGQRAYIVPMGEMKASENYGYVTPQAPAGTVWDDGIVVYPEIIVGNPLGAKTVVRYLLYYAGAYGGTKDFDLFDNVWAFSKPIARDAGISEDKILTIPSVDMQVFVPWVGVSVLRWVRWYSSEVWLTSQ